MAIPIKKLSSSLRDSRLFKDSFWAVFGNGLGYGLLLLAGIIIARFLGKDLYGEYGLVKTTMFQIAAFSTFGLGYTSTKFVAQYKKEDSTQLRSIIDGSLSITGVSSFVLALVLVVLAVPIANYLGEPHLFKPLRYLGIIIIFKAFSTTLQGILAGLGNFKIIAQNNVISGIVMLILCVPLTIYFGLAGSLLSLALSQFANAAFNALKVIQTKRSLSEIKGLNYVKRLLSFSIPVAMQEFSYTAASLISSAIVVKYSSLGQLGIYSACQQWNAIIVFIPGLLSNVVLSHLSASLDDSGTHSKTLKRMLLVNFVSTFIPFCLVFVFRNFIASFYGPTFQAMPIVMTVLVFSTIFQCCSSVFQSELISKGETWALFSIRFFRDTLIIITMYLVLSTHNPEKGALYNAEITVLYSFIYFLILILYYLFNDSLKI